MKNLAKPSRFSRQTGMKKFVLAILTIATLSGAALVVHSGPAAAWWCGHTCNSDGE